MSSLRVAALAIPGRITTFRQSEPILAHHLSMASPELITLFVNKGLGIRELIGYDLVSGVGNWSVGG